MQKQVDDWVSQYKIGYWKPLEILGRLTEETGELARELNNTYGPKVRKEGENKNDITDESADIMFTLICLANSLNLDLESAFQRIIDKCYSRDKDRWEKIEKEDSGEYINLS